MPTIVGILTFVSMVNTTPAWLKAEQYKFSEFYPLSAEEMACSVGLSMTIMFYNLGARIRCFRTKNLAIACTVGHAFIFWEQKYMSCPRPRPMSDGKSHLIALQLTHEISIRLIKAKGIK